MSDDVTKERVAEALDYFANILARRIEKLENIISQWDAVEHEYCECAGCVALKQEAERIRHHIKELPDGFDA